MSKDAHDAYRAQQPPSADGDRPRAPGLALESRSIETGHGPTLLVSSRDEDPEEAMVLLSAALLRRLLAAARAMGPRRPKRRPRKPRGVDIRI